MNLVTQWVPLVLTIILWTIVFCSRNWLIAKIKSSVEHTFNSKIEILKSDLRSKEAEISTLRDSVLANRNQRQAFIDKRKIEAIDNLWKNVTELQRFKAISNAMSTINLEKAQEEAQDNPNVRRFFETINKLAPKIEDIPPSTASNERPFLSVVAWAYFSALQTILFGALARAKMLEFGVKDMINTEYEQKLLKAALPHQSDNIDKYGPAIHHHLIEELENNLLKELNNILDGKDSDQASLNRAAEIQKEIDKVKAERKI